MSQLLLMMSLMFQMADPPTLMIAVSLMSQKFAPFLMMASLIMSRWIEASHLMLVLTKMDDTFLAVHVVSIEADPGLMQSSTVSFQKDDNSKRLN